MRVRCGGGQCQARDKRQGLVRAQVSDCGAAGERRWRFGRSRNRQYTNQGQCSLVMLIDKKLFRLFFMINN